MGPVLDPFLLGGDPIPLDPRVRGVAFDRRAGSQDDLILPLEVVSLHPEPGELLLEVRALRVELRLRGIEFALAGVEGVLRFLELRGRRLDGVQQHRGGLIARHVYVTANRGATTSWCVGLYLSRASEESFMRT